jgi:hypothetical protein
MMIANKVASVSCDIFSGVGRNLLIRIGPEFTRRRPESHRPTDPVGVRLPLGMKTPYFLTPARGFGVAFSPVAVAIASCE